MKNLVKKIFLVLSLFCIGFTVKTIFHLSVAVTMFFTMGLFLLVAVGGLIYVIYKFRNGKWLM